jgi:hypothetical protein
MTDSATGLAIDHSDNMYLLDGAAGQVKKFSPSGQLLASWGSQGAGNGQFNRPSGLALDPAGNVYVADTGNNRIQKFDAAGNFLATWGGQESGCAAGSFDEPRGIATDGEGNVYVADTGHFCIQVYGPNGQFLRKWGADGSAPGQFQHGPVSVAVGPNDEIYTVNDGDDPDPTHWTFDDPDRVQVFTEEGTFLREWGDDVSAVDLLVTSAGVYAIDHLASGLRTPTGELLAYEGNVGYDSRDGGAATDSAGRIYVTWAGWITRVDPGVPAAVLGHEQGPNDFPQTVLTGQQVRLLANGSKVWFGSVAKYEWDLDGNGSFELDTGTTPHTTTSFDRPGDVDVRLRVTSTVGKTAVAAYPLMVWLTSPPGEPGLTINDGGRFTNNPNVTLKLAWGGDHWTHVTVSNHADFRDSVELPLAEEIPWTLSTSGSEQEPKKVYVRFSTPVGQGDVHESQPVTVQRGIVLDQTAPALTGVKVAARTTDGYELVIDAKDATSGVDAMQIASVSASAPSFTKYTRRATYRGTAAPRVRVRDRAGNVSGWTKVRFDAAQPKRTLKPRALCRHQSKTDPRGKRKSPFAQCVAAMRQLKAGKKTSAKKACRRLPRKVARASKRPSPRKRCVRSGKKLLAALKAS